MADRPLNLVLIDSDSIFRLGLQAALQAQSVVESVWVQPDLAIALEQLIDSPGKPGAQRPDLVLLNLGSLARDEGLGKLERSLRQFRRTLPDIPVMGLEYNQPASLDLWSQRMNLNGYWARGRSMAELVLAIQQVLRGQQVWTLGSNAEQAITQSSATPLSSNNHRPGPWNRTISSGIQQVEIRLRTLERQRQSPTSGWLDQAWLAGCQRELRTTRWLLNRLGGVPKNNSVPDTWELENSSSVPLTPTVPSLSVGTAPRPSNPGVLATSEAIALQTTDNPLSGASTRELQNILFERIAQRIPPALLNGTDEPLEIDILNSAKRQELISTVLRCFGELLLDLRLSNPDMDFVREKRQELLLDLWQASLSDFLGRYSSLNLNGETVELLPILLQEQQNIAKTILTAIPQSETILGALLLEHPVSIDGVDYRPASPEALDRLVWLTENLIITLANAVVQPLLNHVAEVEAIRQSFYDKRLLSTREIEKFRNNLSWKYRVAHLFREAQDIYESRHWLLGFGDRGIEKISVYATRRQELTQLTPLQQSVTLMLEVRDAMAPRLQFLTSWMGSGVVYVLTHVVGRGIGLIGLGIIQGVGSSIQEVRNLSKNNTDKT